MARPIHNTVNNLLTRSLVKLIKADFFTEHEETRISTNIDGDVLPSMHIVEGSQKPQAWTKFPDAAIVFGAADEPQVPTAVFEVEFTEAYDDLQNDAAQWLKSLPSVQLVVMIDIREDVKTLRKIRSKETVLNRLHDLVKQFGNWTSDDEHDSGSESDRSTPDLYSRINDSTCSADFVGPLSAHLELWERSDGAPRLRQPAIVSSPLFLNPLLFPLLSLH